MENTKKSCPSSSFYALIPTEVKESLLRDLGDCWVRSKPKTLVEVLGEGGQQLQKSVQSWPSTMEELAWDRIQTFLMLQDERPCWTPLLAPKRLRAIIHHLKLSKVAQRIASCAGEKGETLQPNWGAHQLVIQSWITLLESTGKSIHNFLLAVSYNMVISSTT